MDLTHLGADEVVELPRQSQETDAQLNSARAQARLKRDQPIKRNAPNSACRRCRQRKVKCDGQLPCAFCAARDGVCVYGAAISPTADDVYDDSDPKYGAESALISSFRRMHYLDMFVRHVHRFFPIMQINTNVMQMRGGMAVMSPSENLQETIALSLASRALGHIDISNGLFNQARVIASSVMDDFRIGTAAGVFLMGMFQLGEDNQLARHYLSVAQSLSRQCESTPKSKLLERIIEELRILEHPHRTFRGKRLEAPIPFPVAAMGSSDTDNLNAMFEHPFLEELMDGLRGFPIHCEVLDVYCATSCLERFPIEHRSNNYVRPEKIEIMLRSLEMGDSMMADMAASETLPVRRDPEAVRVRVINHHSITWGLRLLTCTLGGLVRLGCHYARRALESLQRMSGRAAGFNHIHHLSVGFGLVSFAAIYKEHLHLGGLNYKSFVLEVCDTLRPLNQFKVIRDMIACGERAICQDQIPGLPPSMFDDDFTGRWAVPSREPLSADDVIEQVKRRHHVLPETAKSLIETIMDQDGPAEVEAPRAAMMGLEYSSPSAAAQTQRGIQQARARHAPSARTAMASGPPRAPVPIAQFSNLPQTVSPPMHGTASAMQFDHTPGHWVPDDMQHPGVALDSGPAVVSSPGLSHRSTPGLVYTPPVHTPGTHPDEEGSSASSPYGYHGHEASDSAAPMEGVSGPSDASMRLGSVPIRRVTGWGFDSYTVQSVLHGTRDEVMSDV